MGYQNRRRRINAAQDTGDHAKGKTVRPLEIGKSGSTTEPDPNTTVIKSVIALFKKKSSRG